MIMQIGQEPALGAVLGVRDIISCRGSLTRNLTDT